MIALGRKYCLKSWVVARSLDYLGYKTMRVRSIIFTLTTDTVNDEQTSVYVVKSKLVPHDSCRAKANKEQSKNGGKEYERRTPGNIWILYIVNVLYEKEINIQGIGHLDSKKL